MGKMDVTGPCSSSSQIIWGVAVRENAKPVQTPPLHSSVKVKSYWKKKKKKEVRMREVKEHCPGAKTSRSNSTYISVPQLNIEVGCPCQNKLYTQGFTTLARKVVDRGDSRRFHELKTTVLFWGKPILNELMDTPWRTWGREGHSFIVGRCEYKELNAGSTCECLVKTSGESQFPQSASFVSGLCQPRTDSFYVMYILIYSIYESQISIS